MICVGIVECHRNYRSVGGNTRMMAMNPVHSSDQQSLITFGYLLTLTST